MKQSFEATIEWKDQSKKWFFSTNKSLIKIHQFDEGNARTNPHPSSRNEDSTID